MALSQLTSTIASQEQKLLACVHCGLCLEACPTYVLTGDENDSPRGRIYLMRAVAEGRLASDAVAFERHIDRCLGCRACEPVCPAGVEYGQLLEAGRTELFESGAKRSSTYLLLRVALRHVWLHPLRLKFAFAAARFLRDAGIARVLLKSRIARRISLRFEFGLALLESSAPVSLSAANGKSTSDRSPSEIAALPSPARRESSAVLFTGCVGEALFSRVNQATARVLETNGFNVSVPPGQVCCGALHAHAGDLEGARTLARKNIAAFSARGDSPIITNAGGCGAMLMSYAHLLSQDESFCQRACEFSARIRDVGQQMALVETKKGVDIKAGVITYDASCHLRYGQEASEAALKLLRSIPNLNFIALEGSERCCGAAGIYNLVEPELSKEVLQEKLFHIEQSGAEILATGNPGCQMQIGAGALLAGMKLRVCHPVELLDESYRRAGLYD